MILISFQQEHERESFQKKKLYKHQILCAKIPFLTVALEDFNFKPKNWCSNDFINIEKIFPILIYIRDANTIIGKIIHDFYWGNAFLNLNVDEKFCVSSNMILNIFSNFIPYETILFDDREPSWSDKKIKLVFEEANNAFKNYRGNIKYSDFSEKLNIFRIV